MTSCSAGRWSWTRRPSPSATSSTASSAPRRCPWAATTQAWQEYLDGFKKEFPDVDAQSLFTALYYDGMQAILEALDQTGGKVDDPAAFQQALGSLKPTFPRGAVTLDENRNSVQPNYVVQIVKNGGDLGFKLVSDDRRRRPDLRRSLRARFAGPEPRRAREGDRQPAALGERADRLTDPVGTVRARAPCRQARGAPRRQQCTTQEER